MARPASRWAADSKARHRPAGPACRPTRPGGFRSKGPTRVLRGPPGHLVDGGQWERAFKRPLRALHAVFEVVVVEPAPANDAVRDALLSKDIYEEHRV